MILIATAFVAALGLAAFIIGMMFDHPEIAMLGAIFIIGVGGTAMVDGIQVQVGANQTTEVVESEVAAEYISNASLITVKDISNEDTRPTGIEFSNEGTFVYIAGETSSTVYQYSTTNYDLSLATLNDSLDVSGQITSLSDAEITDTGSRLVAADSGTGIIHEWRLSKKHNLSSATYEGSFDASEHVSAPSAVEMGLDGTQMFILDETNATINEYDLSEAYNISSATYNRTFNLGAQDGTPTGMDFDEGGRRLVIAGEESDRAYQYSLSIARDIDTAVYTGQYLELAGETSTVSGIAYEDHGKSLFVVGYLDNDAHQFDTSATKTSETTETTRSFESISAITGFPVDVIIMLLGAVLFFAATGKAGDTDMEER